ncbi:Heat shock factor binding protein 1-like [Oopsacas minuta]|uniref:Heat shock factor binding protein 1-like n=1 Tax=Oopsacas minuta TaxID=111878 RepID=A0AAV7JDE9_9METZ|nr:Heat shock factor binding protein 1-like [Oopsacas minuta]
MIDPDKDMNPSKQEENNPGQQGAESARAQDLSLVIGRLLQDMQGKFEEISTQITSKLDEMSDRVEQLEQNVQGLMEQIEEKEKEVK